MLTMRTTTVQVGDNIAILIPDEIMKETNWHIDDMVDVSYDEEHRRFIIKKPDNE